MPMYRPVAPVYIRFMDQSILAFQSVSRNSEGHVESVEPIKCMFFILMCNIYVCVCVYVCVCFNNTYKTYLASRARAIIPVAIGVEKDVPCMLSLSLVHPDEAFVVI